RPCSRAPRTVPASSGDLAHGGAEGMQPRVESTNLQGAGVKTPTLPGGGLFGHIGAMRKDPLGFLLGAMREGDVVRIRIVHQTTFLLFHPDHVRYVLQDNYQNYTKHTMLYSRIRAIFGESLTTADGDFWLRQRKLAQPGFHRERLAGYASGM